MPAEVLALAYKQDNGSASRFDCQRPKVSFIVYNNALLFQDSALQDLNMQAVGSKIISAKVGLSLESLQLVDTEILITFPSSVSTNHNERHGTFFCFQMLIFFFFWGGGFFSLLLCMNT